MATSVREIGGTSAPRLGVGRVAMTTALAATAFLLLCWIAARLGLGPATHMYIQLFSPADVGSGLALLVGLCWSLAGGLVAGALFAWTYNLLAAFDPR